MARGENSFHRPGSAAGGALYNAYNGDFTAANSTFANNSAYGGAAYEGDGGGEGEGGAVSSAGRLVMRNVTLSGNASYGGVSYNYPSSQTAGGSGLGGAISTGGNAALTNCTLASDAAIGGWAGNGGSPGSSLGGEIYAYGGTNILKNTIVAYSPSGSNIWGGVTDAGNNLSSDPTGGFTAPTSHTSTNPLLGAIGNYGGSTPTIPLLYGSPAIDAGDTTAAPLTDQRGFVRPFGSAADIGAYEWGAAPAIAPWFISCRNSTNAVELQLCGEIGRVFQVHTSANLTQWFWRATLTNQNGQMYIVDTSGPSEPKRFYRAVQLP